jgi:3-dehydroquinate synthase
MQALHQDFRVQFRYDVHFTRGVFQTTNPTLLNVISSSAGTQRKTLVIMEESVRDAFPSLLDQIARYAGSNPDAMQLVADPLLVPGGELLCICYS